VGRLGGYLKRPAQILAGCVGALIAVGLLWAVVTGADVRQSVADALFVGGVVIVAFAVATGTGARGGRVRGDTGGQTPFGTVALGALVVLAGVAVLKLF
jgi:hypothetical protein